MNQDSGVAEFEAPHGMVEYTYEHTEEIPQFETDWYQITTILRLVDRPIHKNVYFYPQEHLAEFFRGYDQTGEMVIDVRPVTTKEMLTHFNKYPLED